MPLEINKISSRTMPVQEIALNRLVLDLDVGDRFRAVVLAIDKHNEMTLDVNGKLLNAKTSHAFVPGEVLELQVATIGEQILLRVKNKTSALPALLNKTLLKTLPRQAAPSNLFDSLGQLSRLEHLPADIISQIKTLLNSIVPLEQLPQGLMNAVLQSGLFLEATLLRKNNRHQSDLLKDLKGLYIRLLSSLEVTDKQALGLSTTLPGPNLPLEKDNLPLPGAVPQPTQQNTFLNLIHESSETIQNVLFSQLSEVLARITAQQIYYLSRSQEQGYALLLDLPIKTEQGIYIIPLLIEEHKAALPLSSMWSISFAISLASLGNLQGTVSLYKKNHINLTVFLEKMEKKVAIEGLEDPIRKILKRLDLNLNRFTIAEGLKPNHIEPGKIKLLDIRI